MAASYAVERAVRKICNARFTDRSSEASESRSRSSLGVRARAFSLWGGSFAEPGWLFCEARGGSATEPGWLWKRATCSGAFPQIFWGGGSVKEPGTGGTTGPERNLRATVAAREALPPSLVISPRAQSDRRASCTFKRVRPVALANCLEESWQLSPSPAPASSARRVRSSASPSPLAARANACSRSEMRSPVAQMHGDRLSWRRLRCLSWPPPLNFSKSLKRWVAVVAAGAIRWAATSDDGA